MSVINISVLKQFLEEKYARQLVFKTDNVEILLVCWLPDHRAEVHEHGNSDAITLILEGEMSHTTIYPDGKKVSGVLSPGDIEHIPVGVKHEVANNKNEKLVSLHIYSPPLDEKLLGASLGYSNKIRLNEVQLLEKTISYLMADKPLSKLMFENKIPLSEKIFSTDNVKRSTIAIIGGGFSGTLVATHLMHKYSGAPLQIMLIERASRFSRGFAYSTNNPMHLLNVPADKMSAFPNDPNHFLKWAQGRDSNIKAQTFVPRMLYGEYLENVLREAENNKPSEIKFKRLNDEAISIKLLRDNSGAIIHLDSGIQLPVNCAILALGNYLPRDPFVSDTSFYKSKRYAKNPWSEDSLENVSTCDEVLLIGTGLTMVDKVIELKSLGHSGTIHAVSRHGLLPQPHDLNVKPFTIDVDSLKELLSTRKLLKFTRENIKLATKNGSNWRSVIDSLRLHVQKIWKSLPHEEKQKFFHYIRPYWDSHRHRMPPEIVNIIYSMIESGKLKIYKGKIKEYDETENNVSVLIQEKSKSEKTILQVTKVINCTGSELDFSQIQEPLIVDLLKQGLIYSDKLSLGVEANPNGKISNILYTLGPPLKGQLLETTAVPEIREQAYSLASEIIKSLMLSELKPKEEIDQLIKEFNYTI